MLDREWRAIERQFRCGDATVIPRLLALIDRGVAPQSLRVEIGAAQFGWRLADALREANGPRRARTVSLDRVAERLARVGIPATIRGGTPPLKRLDAPPPGAPDCLETVLHVGYDAGGVRVRAGVVLYEGRESVEIDLVTFTEAAPAAILWADRHLRGRATTR